MKRKKTILIIIPAILLFLCAGFFPAPGSAGGDSADTAVRFNLSLDSYTPAKDHYNFYFTYKIVHPWWDAVAMGMEEAQRQYQSRGITVTYEYLAPETASAEDQIRRLNEAAGKNYDVIGVDVADESAVSPVLDSMVEKGIRVMTFSSSDAAPGCRRIAYVGNTHNYEDGAQLAEALCEKLGGKGKIAVLVGTRGAPCHEERAAGVQDTVARYPDMEIVAVEYDQDSIALAHDLAVKILEQHRDLAGFICCNMSNPVGAARAVKETGSSVVIVGMDHDREALRYLQDGTIYCLGIQDCFSIGFDTVQVAVKVADGIMPGEIYPEKTEEQTTMIYREDAPAMLELLYGEF